MVDCHLSQICNSYVGIPFLLNIFISKGPNSANFCMCIGINKIKILIGMHDFGSKVVTLD